VTIAARTNHRKVPFNPQAPRSRPRRPRNESDRSHSRVPEVASQVLNTVSLETYRILDESDIPQKSKGRFQFQGAGIETRAVRE
jgi:hypothetical protein